MHLSNLPTIFVKDGIERKAYFTVQARELLADGWTEKGEAKEVEPAVAEPTNLITEKPKVAAKKVATKKEDEE